MLSVQRQFGKLKKRGADESQVSVLLKDFEEADVLLTKIIDASKAWRDSWSSILNYQHRLIAEFEGLYAPILGAGNSYQGHQPIETPEAVLMRTAKLREEYTELKKDLMVEVGMVDDKLIKPAMDARDSLGLMKKTIKKREDRKLDFERYQSRVEAGRKKTKRSDRENTALTKAELDLDRATEEYNTADDNLRQTLPRLITVTFSLLPHLLANQIEIQNTLLAHYYTMLHNYCTDEGFPNPAPPMDEVIRLWDDEFKATRRDVEAISLIANGKGIRFSLKLEETNGSSNGYPRRPSAVSRVSSTSPSRAILPPNPTFENKPRIGSSSSLLLLPPSDSQPPTPSEHQVAASPAGIRPDYFARERQISNTSAASSMTNLSMTIAGKKKPPPPPPRGVPAHFVTALYDFGGQGDGDLAFREGDRIKVIKKSESTDDWWQGELRGVKGSFPANYCQ